ncbi:MAG: PQQ-binding-like beta-propeller repeat protein [Candidatus Krumholzibacteriota bacterium]|nr:PQQ-binding-like beta-propeller repeat protein [Candidatus Krumholzibacteriota bacterium]
MRNTCFICQGSDKDRESFVYHENPTNSRGEEFFVFFSTPERESEQAIQRLFRLSLSNSRLGDPSRYFQKVIESFSASVDNLEFSEESLSGSLVVIMIRRGREVSLLCSKATEILYYDSARKFEGPVKTLPGLKESAVGKERFQAELFEKSVDDYFRLYRFRIAKGRHTLVFAPSQEFIGQNIVSIRDNLFFPSVKFTDPEIISTGSETTFPVMHWDGDERDPKTTAKDSRSRSMIRSKAPYITGGLAIIVAILFIFKPFDRYRTSDTLRDEPLLSVQDENTVAPEEETNIAGPAGSETRNQDGSDSVADQPTVKDTGRVMRPGEFVESWKRKFDAPVTSSPSVDDGQIVFGCRDAYIYSYGTDGTLRWKYKAEEGVGSSPFFSGPLCIGADYTGNIFRLDRSTGERLWNYDSQEKIITTPRITGGTVVLGTMEGNLISLDLAGGKRNWIEKLGSGIWASPAVSEDCIIAATTDGSLVRLSQAGRIEWRVKPGGGIYSNPLMAVDKDLVFFGSDDKYVYAYSISNGHLMWRFPGGSKMRGKPETDGVNLYIGSEDGVFYAITYNGRLAWKADLGGAVRSKPLIMDDMIIVTVYNSKVYAIDIKTGSLLGEYKIESPVYSSPATDGDRIFFGSNQGYLHAVSVKGEL